jgi:hypothetical protein
MIDYHGEIVKHHEEMIEHHARIIDYQKDIKPYDYQDLDTKIIIQSFAGF